MEVLEEGFGACLVERDTYEWHDRLHHGALLNQGHIARDNRRRAVRIQATITKLEELEAATGELLCLYLIAVDSNPTAAHTNLVQRAYGRYAIQLSLILEDFAPHLPSIVALQFLLNILHLLRLTDLNNPIHLRRIPHQLLRARIQHPRLLIRGRRQIIQHNVRHAHPPTRQRHRVR
jgi:hypothetical protein